MLTAALRDLHRNYPGEFFTDVRSSAPELWWNNPFITSLDENNPEVEQISCHYPLIRESNRSPTHFIHGFPRFLSERLGVRIEPTEFKGDVHLTSEEKTWPSELLGRNCDTEPPSDRHESSGEEFPFWIVVSGGKSDFTTKWWEPARYQSVIDHFDERIQFVQVGTLEHYHPELRGVLDLRGRTNIRQLVRLMYHAQGVLCPVTFAMHLAAAVETKLGMPKHRPCVVVAGGREPMQWEAYPHHQYIHTNGMLSCCQDGGCWKSRVVPLGDGDEKDKPEHLCTNVVDNRLPRCLDMITAAEVIRRIEMYFEGGVISYLSEKQRDAAKRVMHEQNARSLFSRERVLPFLGFKNKYLGRTCWVVGRGPTEFSYAELAKVDDPVFFINDAVSLEKHVRNESFFFAHDAKQQVWLQRGLKSTAVLPVGGKLWENRGTSFLKDGSLVLYRWRTTEGEKLLSYSRAAVAGVEELYTHSGTIHSVIHFIWYCGFKKIVFVGCDGINDKTALTQLGDPTTGYDTRLENLSQTSPYWVYGKIRRVQDRLCHHFKLETEYVGTPAVEGSKVEVKAEPFPKLAHFTWLGGPLPPLAQKNIERFRRLHRDWEVRLWIGVPHGMPDDLVDIIYSVPDLCMRADIIRYWLLHRFGGLYLDADTYVLRNMSDLRDYDFFVTRSHDHKTFFNSVIGCPPQSRAAEGVLEEVRRSFGNGAAERRCHYGPDLIGRIYAHDPRLLTILPEHYFYIFHTQRSAVKFALATPTEQEAMLNVISNRITDGVQPFAVHTWGIPREHSHEYYRAARSSWERALPQSDALLRKLSRFSTEGLVIGDLDGRISAYLLGHHPLLHLTIVMPRHVQNGYADPVRCNGKRANPELAFTGTAFAHDRRRITDDDYLDEIPDKSLDFVLLNAGASDGDIPVEFLRSKLKDNGFFCGPPPMPALNGSRVSRVEGNSTGTRSSGEWWFIHAP